MNLSRLVQPTACLVLAAGMSACSMFGSKSRTAQAAPVSQEFDLYSNTWKPATQFAVAPPSVPNADLAMQKEQQKKEAGVISSMGRSASKVGSAMTKPLKYIPFVGGSKKSEADPEYTPAPDPGS
jgi:hypothetical protein